MEAEKCQFRMYAHGTREIQALHGFTLNIKAGEYLSVMGPSGSGKSTLLNQQHNTLDCGMGKWKQ